MPPLPTSPGETFTRTDPALPPTADPVTKLKVPLDPEDEVPERNRSSPETPSVPASRVKTTTNPLLEAADNPVLTDNEPPVKPFDNPVDKETSEPAPVSPVPVESTTEPLLPATAVPVATTI